MQTSGLPCPEVKNQMFRIKVVSLSPKLEILNSKCLGFRGLGSLKPKP